MNDISELITSALSSLDYPVSQPPGDAQAVTYITWNETGQYDVQSASNQPMRVRHLIQIHAWHHRGYYDASAADEDPGAHRTALAAAIRALKAAGMRIYATGPDQYEKDTDMYHISCTAEYYERYSD